MQTQRRDFTRGVQRFGAMITTPPVTINAPIPQDFQRVPAKITRIGRFPTPPRTMERCPAPRTFNKLPVGAVFIYRGKKYVKRDATHAGSDVLNGSRGKVVAFGAAFGSLLRNFSRMRVRMPFIGLLDPKFVEAAF